jgi:hypothetical protein
MTARWGCFVRPLTLTPIVAAQAGANRTAIRPPPPMTSRPLTDGGVTQQHNLDTRDTSRLLVSTQASRNSDTRDTPPSLVWTQVSPCTSVRMF